MAWDWGVPSPGNFIIAEARKMDDGKTQRNLLI
jgi:hypothetical protein